MRILRFDVGAVLQPTINTFAWRGTHVVLIILGHAHAHAVE